jgi:single-strand DNA-binding protein
MSLNNDVRFRGNLVNDPVAVDINVGGETVKKATFRLAVNNGKNRAQVQRPATFIDVECFRGRAETIIKYLHKGDEIIVAGELLPDNWTDKEGHNRTRMYVALTDFTFGRRRTDRPVGAEQPTVATPAQPAPRPVAQSAPSQYADDMFSANVEDYSSFDSSGMGLV